MTTEIDQQQSQKMAIIEIIAYMVNETLCGFCRSIGEDRLSWVEMTEEARNSLRSGVIYRLANQTISLEDQHKAWLREKSRTGWVFGPNKNDELRTHPSMVAYEHLPQSERSKNEIFVSLVLSAGNSLLAE